MVSGILKTAKSKSKFFRLKDQTAKMKIQSVLFGRSKNVCRDSSPKTFFFGFVILILIMITARAASIGISGGGSVSGGR